MAMSKELLQIDLYALLGIEEKAADKEVRVATRMADLGRPSGLSRLDASPAADIRPPRSVGPGAKGAGVA